MNKLLKFKSLAKLSLIAFLIAFCMGSCKDKVNGYLEEQKILEKYLADNNITTQPTSTGLYYIETLEGIGVRARNGMTVSVRYKGYLLDGTVFDDNLDSVDPLTFTIGYGSVIQGWEEGMTHMKDGGKATLIIPSSLAYGASGSETIPAYSTLIFEVELVNVQ